MRPRFLLSAGEPDAGALLRFDRAGLRSKGRCGHWFLHAGVDDPVQEMPVINGWIVGRLFDRHGNDPVEEIPRDAQSAIAATDGRHLVDHYWGSYVAIWRDPESSFPILLRDPSATQPAFLHRGPNGATVASDLDILRDNGSVRASIDWPGLAHHLRYPLLQAALTCIEAVREILPGETATLGPVPRFRQLWHPASFMTRSTAASASDAQCEDLARKIDDVVAAVSRHHRHIQLELSGGLDSSVLAAALSRASVSWDAVTMATAHPEGDEREYARLVADFLDASLHSKVMTPDVIMPMSCSAPLTPRPTGVRMLHGLDRLYQEAAVDVGADASMCGAGGDNVFCYLRSTAPVLDAWDAGGPRLALQALSHIVAFTEVGWWEAGASLARRWRRERRGILAWPAADVLLSADVRPLCRGHPWLEGDRPMTTGERAHVRAVLCIHSVFPGHARASQRTLLLPLLSQPVMEACFGIPSWQWFVTGRDREPVRRGYKHRLPAAIIERRRKGHFQSIVSAAFARDCIAFRPLLLEGRLASAGLIDRRAIAAALWRPEKVDVAMQTRLLELLDAELWVQTVEA